MKKAAALLELVFAVVLMGIALAGFGPALLASHKAAEQNKISEYVNAADFLTSLAGSLPHNPRNFCVTETKTNTPLAQICSPAEQARYGDDLKVKFYDDESIVRAVYKRDYNYIPERFGYRIFEQASNKALNADFTWHDGEMSHTFNLANMFDKLEPSKTISTIRGIEIGSTTAESHGIQIPTDDGKNFNFRTALGSMGRTESLYYKYVLQVDNDKCDTACQKKIQADLEFYKNQGS